MVNPKFSILIPNYNHGTFLEQAILSVVSQDYKNKELIVIDGGSTDDSVAIIKKYEGEITYWVSEKDKGTYDANNKGLKKITGDFWCILNSDDVLMPEALTKMSKIIHENPDEKWIAGAVDVIDAQEQKINELIPQAPDPIEGYTFLNGCWISHPATFLHRDLITTIGLFDSWHLMDFSYWLRMEKMKFFPFVTHEKMAALRIHPDCKSYNTVSFHKEMFSIMTAFCAGENISKLPAVKKRLKDYSLRITRMSIASDLVNDRRAAAFKNISAFIVHNPAIVFKRFVWGMLFRSIIGLRQDDPLVKRFKDDGLVAWDY